LRRTAEGGEGNGDRGDQERWRQANRSLLKQIAQHEAWIGNPYLKFEANEQPEIIRYHQQVKWRNDIARQREQINILEGVIHERESQK
jgi:hypothetical protein